MFYKQKHNCQAKGLAYKTKINANKKLNNIMFKRPNLNF